MEENKMSYDKLCYTLAKLTEEEQNNFFESLRGVITEEEKQALQIGVAYFRMLLYPKVSSEIKVTLAQVLYETFNKEKQNTVKKRITCEQVINTPWRRRENYDY